MAKNKKSDGVPAPDQPAATPKIPGTKLAPVALPPPKDASIPAPATKAPAARKAPAVAKPANKKAARPSNADISLRAYFISEKRRAQGRWGNEQQDWVEAERQLRAEAAKSTPTRKRA